MAGPKPVTFRYRDAISFIKSCPSLNLIHDPTWNFRVTNGNRFKIKGSKMELTIDSCDMLKDECGVSYWTYEVKFVEYHKNLENYEYEFGRRIYLSEIIRDAPSDVLEWVTFHLDIFGE